MFYYSVRRWTMECFSTDSIPSSYILLLLALSPSLPISFSLRFNFPDGLVALTSQVVIFVVSLIKDNFECHHYLWGYHLTQTLPIQQGNKFTFNVIRIWKSWLRWIKVLRFRSSSILCRACVSLSHSQLLPQFPTQLSKKVFTVVSVTLLKFMAAGEWC